jgi:hypothetical protein
LRARPSDPLNFRSSLIALFGDPPPPPPGFAPPGTHIPLPLTRHLHTRTCYRTIQQKSPVDWEKFKGLTLVDPFDMSESSLLSLDQADYGDSMRWLFPKRYYTCFIHSRGKNSSKTHRTISHLPTTLLPLCNRRCTRLRRPSRDKVSRTDQITFTLFVHGLNKPLLYSYLGYVCSSFVAASLPYTSSSIYYWEENGYHSILFCFPKGIPFKDVCIGDLSMRLPASLQVSSLFLFLEKIGFPRNRHYVQPSGSLLVRSSSSCLVEFDSAISLLPVTRSEGGGFKKEAVGKKGRSGGSDSDYDIGLSFISNTSR